MPERLPLPTLLSFALVAFTIELDNEFEQRTPHRTTDGAAASQRGPWLVSLAMWSNLLRLVGPDGAREADLADSGANLAGMERWDWVRATATATGGSRSERILRLTAAGARAATLWPQLLTQIEERWRERFGGEPVRALRTRLLAVLDGLGLELPAYLPVLGYGLRSKLPSHGLARAGADASLPTLLAQVLLAFTLDYERRARLALVLSANVTRPLRDGPLALRELPRSAGVSKEAIAMAAGFLAKHEVVTVAPNPASRGQLIALTAKGRRSLERHRRTLAEIETRWEATLGTEELRASLEALGGDGTAAGSPLFAGLEPGPGGWRASRPPVLTLPHQPIVLHRGGYPDGS